MPPGFELPNIWLLSDILKNSGIKDAQKLLSFDMSDLDRPDKSLFDEVADEAAQAAFGTRPAEDEEPRDSAWLRWVKPFSIILVPAIVLGVVFALGDYVRQYTATMQFDRAVARGWVKLDTWDWFWRRFLQGVCAGAAFGLLYKIQWHLRNRCP
jgi:hypothetical protein